MPKFVFSASKVLENRLKTTLFTPKRSFFLRRPFFSLFGDVESGLIILELALFILPGLALRLSPTHGSMPVFPTTKGTIQLSIDGVIHSHIVLSPYLPGHRNGQNETGCWVNEARKSSPSLNRPEDHVQWAVRSIPTAHTQTETIASQRIASQPSRPGLFENDQPPTFLLLTDVPLASLRETALALKMYS